MDDLVGLMRLARKYQAEELYKHCITVFQNAWPATLSDFARRNADLMRIWSEQKACSAQDDPGSGYQTVYVGFFLWG